MKICLIFLRSPFSRALAKCTWCIHKVEVDIYEFKGFNLQLRNVIKITSARERDGIT